jgi:hypothetical protein
VPAVTDSRNNHMRRGIPGVLFGLSLLALTVFGAAPVEGQPTTGQQTHYNEAHPLLAYYYAWWEPPKISGALFTPVQPYPAWVQQIGDDPDLMRQHVAQAQSAGIDGFIVNRSSDLNHLLDVVRGSDFRLSLQVDAGSDPASEIDAFYKHIGDPNLIRYQGQPVLFFWYVRGHTAAFWSDLRGRIDPQHTALWIADGDDFSVLGSATWDGISPYAIAWSSNPRSQLPAWAAKARNAAPNKLYVPPVSPGCDDHLAHTATCVQERAGGAYYQATLDGAAASNPAWAIVVSTFNEWMEATQIEPATQYGDEYLDLTRAFADTWHAAAGHSSAGVSATTDPE